MKHERYVSLVLILSTVALSGAACVLDPETIGEAVSGSSTGDSQGVTDTKGSSTGSTDATDTTMGGGSGGGGDSSTGGDAIPYGAPCELEGLALGKIQVTAISPQDACDGGVCLFPFGDAVVSCEEDAECSAQPPYVSCGEGGLCVLDPDYVAAESQCTQACQSDDECPEVPGCESQTACVPMATLGPLCCEKVCACLDNFDSGDVEIKTLMCEEEGACA